MPFIIAAILVIMGVLILFGLICDNNFYIKVTEPGRAILKEVILRPPYDGAKDYFYITHSPVFAGPEK